MTRSHRALRYRVALGAAQAPWPLASGRASLVVALMLAGCGGVSSPEAESPPPPTSPATSGPTSAPTSAPAVPAPAPDPSAVAEAPPSSSAGYDVHEWGFIDVLDGAPTEIGSGPGRPTAGMAVRKPVLYFHLDGPVAEGGPPLSVDVSARLVGGAILETFPPDTRPSADVAHWAISLSMPHCATRPLGDPSGAIPSGAARRLSRACDTADGICEVDALPGYDASTTACVEVEGTRAGLLFYRGTASPTLPLRVVRNPDTTVTVTGVAAMEGAPGRLLRVVRSSERLGTVGDVFVSRADVPAVGASVTLSIGTERVDSGPGRTAAIAELRASLGALGLDAAETDAFMNAWTFGLFTAGAASGRAHEGAPEVPDDAVIYFLPEASVNGIAALELSPPPRALRRAFMVRVILPSGA